MKNLGPVYSLWLSVMLGVCAQAANAAASAEPSASPSLVPSASPVQLQSGFTLEQGGQTYTLADIVPPLTDEKMRKAAEGWLSQQLSREAWRIQPLGPQPDRYGRTPARFYPTKGMDLAMRMVRQGYASVSFDIPYAKRSAALLAQEQKARQEGRGLWESEHPFDFLQSEAAEGRYGQVEGRILSVDKHNGHVFLAFGSDWRSDPTGFIPARAVARFTDPTLDALVGKQVRLRGWIEEQNGPSILLVQPYALEIVP